MLSEAHKQKLVDLIEQLQLVQQELLDEELEQACLRENYSPLAIADTNVLKAIDVLQAVFEPETYYSQKQNKYFLKKA